MKEADKKLVEEAFAAAAKENGVSVEEVRREIAAAIEDAQASADPQAQSLWRAIPCEGDYPTPEEFMLHLMKGMR